MEVRIALYMRLSMEDKENEEESNSILNQRLLLRRFVLDKFADVKTEVMEFVDDGYSGTNFDRPSVKELLENAKEAKIDCIIVKDFSRFSRDYIEMGAYLEQIFPFLGIRFISVNDHYDSNDYIGKSAGMDTSFKYLVNDLYAKDISVKVKSTLEMKREKGIYANGSTPFGYMKSKEDCHLLEPVEPEAGIIRRIFQMTLEGYSSSKIAKLFNEEGVMTPMEYKIKRGITMMKPKGNRFLWDGSTICQMLRNDFYAGDWVYGKYETNAVGGKARLKPRSEWKIYYNHHEAIIDRETFKMVQQSRGRKKSVQKREKHPLTGKIVCGCCGKNLKIEHSLNPYFFCATRYKTDSPECVKKVNVMFIEQMILYMLQQEMVKQEEVSKWQQDCAVQLGERYENVIQQINRIDAEVKLIEEEKMEGYEKYRRKEILVDEYRKFMELLRGKEEKLTVEKGRLEGRLEKIKNKITETNEEERHEWGGGDITELNQDVVDTFVEKIVVRDEKNVEIRWKFRRDVA